MVQLVTSWSTMIVLVLQILTDIGEAARLPRRTAGHHLSESDYLSVVAAKTSQEEKTQEFWKNMARTTLKEKLEVKTNRNRAKNVILFLGDGMSITTLTSARIYAGQQNDEFGENNKLSFEKFPITGLSKTYCVDRQVADSACSATAYLGGVKANYGTTGVTAKVLRGECEAQLGKDNDVHSIAKWALDAGKEAGFVTTTRVTHASPAGTYAHSANRDWESDADFDDGENAAGCWDIAKQLVFQDPGRKFKVIMGGGKRELLPNNTDGGRRLDGQNLIDQWIADKKEKNATYAFLENRSDLADAALDQPDYILGLFHDSHMDYHLIANVTQPTLVEMAEVAIRAMSKSENGYFLFIEGGRIDHGHHAAQAQFALDETAEFSKAVALAAKMTDPTDTLIVVTSDHAHVMTMAGYPSRGNDILSTGDLEQAIDDIPYLTLSYANGPGYRKEVDGQRFDVTKDDNFTSGDPRFVYPSLVPKEDESHGGEDVAVFARGPWQHIFSGSYEQNVIPHLLAYAMCINDDCSDHCMRSSSYFKENSGSFATPSVALIISSLVGMISYCIS